MRTVNLVLSLSTSSSLVVFYHDRAVDLATNTTPDSRARRGRQKGLEIPEVRCPMKETHSRVIVIVRTNTGLYRHFASPDEEMRLLIPVDAIHGSTRNSFHHNR